MGHIFLPSHINFWSVVFENLCGQTHRQTPPKTIAARRMRAGTNNDYKRSDDRTEQKRWALFCRWLRRFCEWSSSTLSARFNHFALKLKCLHGRLPGTLCPIPSFHQSTVTMLTSMASLTGTVVVSMSDLGSKGPGFDYWAVPKSEACLYLFNTIKLCVMLYYMYHCCFSLYLLFYSIE